VYTRLPEDATIMDIGHPRGNDVNRLDDAKVEHLRNGLRLLRIAKEQGLTDNLLAREREIRREATTIADPALRAEVLKQCDDLLDK
jgi:hypothetical protein